MKVLFLSLLLSMNAHAYLSYGDATDDCNWSSDKELDKDIWNCEDLYIGTNVQITVATTVTSPIQIRVQGDADIDGDIIVSASGTPVVLPGVGSNENPRGPHLLYSSLQNADLARK